MPAGTAPIYVATPKSPAVLITAANTKNDGAGTIATDMFLLFTAGSNGAFVGKVRFVPSASVASTATTATVGRVYKSTQTSGATTNANTHRLDEVAISAQNVDQATAQLGFFECVLNMPLAAGEAILVSNHHTPAANTVVQAIGIGFGDY